MKWVPATPKRPSEQAEWGPRGELPRACDSLSEPAHPDLWGSQGEDIKQLGEPTLYLPIPRASARLCDPTQGAA